MYDIEMFGGITPVTAYTATDATGTAVYQGPAVGVYVEKRAAEGDQTIVQSGEFTATVVLRADFAGTDTIKGNVGGFQTDQGAKSWNIVLQDGGQARNMQTGLTSTGQWSHIFLARHVDALPADTQPIAAVGTFETDIANVRRIAGAFGVHRTSDPLGQ